MSDVLNRAAKTFVQTFVAALAVPASVYDANAWKAAVTAAVAAAISATWNTVQRAQTAAPDA